MGMIWEKFGLDVLFHVLMLPFGWLPESIVFLLGILFRLFGFILVGRVLKFIWDALPIA